MVLLLIENQRNFIFSCDHLPKYLQSIYFLLYKPALHTMCILKLSILSGKPSDYIYTMSQI